MEWLNNIGSQIFEILIQILFALLILIVGFRLVKVLMKKLSSGRLFSKLDPSVHSFLNNFIGIALKVLLIVTAASVLGVPMASIITLLGSAALAIGLSLQGSLSNLAGGVIILVFRPFKVGDYITCGEIAGTVTDIGIFYTHVTAVDNKVVIVPNAVITNASVTNFSANELRRLDLTFTTGYTSDIGQVKATLLAVADRHPHVLKDPAPMARLTAHGDSSLQFTCRVWVKSEDYWDVNFDLMEEVKKAFDEKGIQIPYPQLDVHISQ